MSMNEIYRLQNPYEISKKAIGYLKDILISKEKVLVAFSLKYINTIFYELLSKENIEWRKVKIFLIEEEDLKKSKSMEELKKIFLSKIEIPYENINFLSEVEGGEKKYKKDIENHLEKYGVSFDLAYMGMNQRGNTGIFYDLSQTFGEKTLEKFYESERNAVSVSPYVINKSRKIIFLIDKENKKTMFDKAVIRKEPYVISQFRNKNTVYLLDFWV